MELLKKLYYDPAIGLSSKDKFFRKAKEIDKSITMKQVKEFLENEATAQITKQVKRNKEYDTIISPAVRNNFQMDIMYLPHPTLNENYKYLLTCIDVYSRYAFVVPMKTKGGDETFNAFKKMIEENGKPANLNLDLGKEFIYNPFKNYCKANDITLWYSDTEQSNKNAIIERFHRTLRNMILRYEVAKGKSYIKGLPDIIKNYNSTYHKTIETNPIDIWSGKKQNTQSIKRVENEFKEGDKVRHLVNKKVFDKGSSTTNYTKKIYTIMKIIGKSIFLNDMTKPFKATELIKAVGENIDENYEKEIRQANREETIKRRLKKAGVI